MSRMTLLSLQIIAVTPRLFGYTEQLGLFAREECPLYRSESVPATR
jgi:hypothetical protein